MMRVLILVVCSMAGLFPLSRAAADDPWFMQHDAFFAFSWPEIQGIDTTREDCEVEYAFSPFVQAGLQGAFGTRYLTLRASKALMANTQKAVNECRSWNFRKELVIPAESPEKPEVRRVDNPVYVFVYNQGVDFSRDIPFLKFNEHWEEDLASWKQRPRFVGEGRFYPDLSGRDRAQARRMDALHVELNEDRSRAFVDASKVCCLAICVEDLFAIAVEDLGLPSSPPIPQQRAMYQADEAGVVMWENGPAAPRWQIPLPEMDADPDQ